MHHPRKPEELWNMQKAKLKIMFPQLDDDDFKYDYGKKDVMMTKLQVKLGSSRKDLNLLLGGL